MGKQRIWEPISFDDAWQNVTAKRVHQLEPSWKIRRSQLQQHPDEFRRFMDRINRTHAIETGLIENLYQLDRGVTETLIIEGFKESLIQSGSTNISTSKLMAYLEDQSNALDFLFDFVKQNRNLSTSFIKELHQLITRSQETTHAISPTGQELEIPLLKGAYKVQPNNPKRDGATFEYCPVEQVASEMDNLVKIYEERRASVNPIVLSAWIHHAFTKIHPFQDGNGRVARLLSSLILVQKDLFPVTISRDERSEYISALERADLGECQELVSVFEQVQIRNIEKALNFELQTANLENAISNLKGTLETFKTKKQQERQKGLQSARQKIFDTVLQIVKDVETKLKKGGLEVDVYNPNQSQLRHYEKDIIGYAKKHNYYFNRQLNRSWCCVNIRIDSSVKFALYFTIHHYGYTDNTIAIGSFLQYVKEDDLTAFVERETTSLPLSIRPLTFSVDAPNNSIDNEIRQFVTDAVTIATTHIADEMS